MGIGQLVVWIHCILEKKSFEIGDGEFGHYSRDGHYDDVLDVHILD